MSFFDANGGYTPGPLTVGASLDVGNDVKIVGNLWNRSAYVVRGTFSLNEVLTAEIMFGTDGLDNVQGILFCDTLNTITLTLPTAVEIQEYLAATYNVDLKLGDSWQWLLSTDVAAPGQIIILENAPSVVIQTRPNGAGAFVTQSFILQCESLVPNVGFGVYLL